MLALKWLLISASVAIFGTAAGVVGYDVYLAMQFHRLMGSGEPGAAENAEPRRSMRWSLAAKLFAWAPKGARSRSGSGARTRFQLV